MFGDNKIRNHNLENTTKGITNISDLKCETSSSSCNCSSHSDSDCSD